jgi:hypothetical protein
MSLSAFVLAIVLIRDDVPDCCRPAPRVALALAEPAVGACNGSATCRVCTNCSRCAHCKGGGTCGICSATAKHAPPMPQPAPPAPRPSTRRPPPQHAEPAELTLRSVRKGKPVDVAASPRSWRALHPPAAKAVDAAQVAAFTRSGVIYHVDNGTRVVELGRHVFREGELVPAPDAIVVRILAGPHKGKVGYVLPGTARDRDGKLGPASAGPDGVESTFGTGEGVPGDEPPRKSTGAPGDGATD